MRKPKNVNSVIGCELNLQLSDPACGSAFSIVARPVSSRSVVRPFGRRVGLSSRSSPLQYVRVSFSVGFVFVDVSCVACSRGRVELSTMVPGSCDV